MSEVNKALMHRFYEEWVHPGNLDVVEEIIAPDCPHIHWHVTADGGATCLVEG